MSRVLVVDDEKSMRATLCEFLTKQGFEAEAAADAQIAFKMIDENDYDVVVTDIIMPRLSGLDLLTKIRERSQTIQVIIMTGEPTVETAVKTVRSGANDYLIKPINKDSFIKAVQYAARIKSLNDEKNVIEKQNQHYARDLEKVVEQRTNSLQVAMQSIISLLASVVEIRDPYTAGHQRRVGNLSATIAGKMNLSKNTIEFIRIIGYIHDIGKICIPTEILSKPGKISRLEMQMIRNHPFSGYEMISRVNLPEVIAETIYQHHERCDGSGYPRGMEISEITIEAQIIMVADVVEAMISHRPYRPALGLEAALQEIEQNSGSLYNPEVVSACVNLFHKDNYVIDDKEHTISFPLYDLNYQI